MSEKIDYGLILDLDDSIADLRPRAEAALKEEGFGVLTEIDVQATIKERLGEDVPAQWILGTCNPPLAHRAMGEEPDIGLLLPCNIVLREREGGGTRVAAINVRGMMAAIDNPGLEEIADEVDARLRRVLEKLRG